MSGCINDVSNNGNDEYQKNIILVDLKGNANFTTINEAVENALEGDTIFVRNGTYCEVIRIDKQLRVLGEDNKNTKICFNQTQAGLLKSNLLITADDCVIEGFTIDCGELNERNKGIEVKSSNNLFENNIFIFGDKGIYLDEETKNNTIKENSFSNNSNGIYLSYSQYNNISNNNFSTSSYFAIEEYGSDFNYISFNNFSNNYNCVRLTGSDGNIVFGNNIKDNNGGILLCCGSVENIIYYNNFIQNENWLASVGNSLKNYWNNESIGNYWGDYSQRFQNATKNNGFWDTPYAISGELNKDFFPLIDPISFYN
jgi:parallel beta-helix repeat protein